MTYKISRDWIKLLAWQKIKISPLNVMFTELGGKKGDWKLKPEIPNNIRNFKSSGKRNSMFPTETNYHSYL